MSLVVDTSAIMAVLLAEAEAVAFGRLIEAEDTFISAGSAIEAVRAITSRRGMAAAPEVRAFLRDFEVTTAPVTEPQVLLAEEGMVRFGIGRAQPPAVLNFGDLFAYALARHMDAPLLFKGDDFTQTDVRAAFVG